LVILRYPPNVSKKAWNAEREEAIFIFLFFLGIAASGGK